MGTSSTDARELLLRGEVTVKGRLPWSSNATFLVEVTLDGARGLAVYKPERGERPLWDFPRGLYRRELAAYVLSEALGWALVPLTVVRDDAPYGEGSLQRFVDADFEQHYFPLREAAANAERLKRICAFDLLANNADRKSGHCLAAEGTIWAIDNGLCFHVEPKLRTVIWDFAGEGLPADVRADVEAFARRGAPRGLERLLTKDEGTALVARAKRLARDGVFPADESGYRYPWPLV